MLHNKGMTLIGMLFTVLSVVILGILLLKIVPVYIDNYSIAQSISVFNKTSINEDDNELKKSRLKEKIISQLNMNSVYDVRPEQIVVEELSPDTYRVTIDYTVTKPLFGSMNLLFIFHETGEVSLVS